MKELRDFSELGLITVTPDDVNNHQGRKLHTKFLNLSKLHRSPVYQHGDTKAQTLESSKQKKRHGPRVVHLISASSDERFSSRHKYSRISRMEYNIRDNLYIGIYYGRTRLEGCQLVTRTLLGLAMTERGRS